jgi:hypothetical protein
MPSYYEAMPIYKAAMNVAVRVDGAVRRFAKGHKYTLGARLRDTAVDVVVLIARCNRRVDRVRELPGLCDRIEELKLMINLGKEVKAFASFNQFVEVRDPEPCGNVKRRRLAYLFERTEAGLSEQEKVA